MDIKATALACAKSRTVWAGVLQYLLNGVLVLMVSGQSHTLDIGIDGNLRWYIPLTLPVLFSMATALLGLLLYGRNKADSPLVMGLSALAQAGSVRPAPPAADQREGA